MTVVAKCHTHFFSPTELQKMRHYPGAQFYCKKVLGLSIELRGGGCDHQIINGKLGWSLSNDLKFSPFLFVSGKQLLKLIKYDLRRGYNAGKFASPACSTGLQCEKGKIVLSVGHHSEAS